MATALDITIAEWQEVKLAWVNRSPLSLDTPAQDGDEESALLGDTVPDAQYNSFQLAQEDQIRLQEALVQLEQKTHEILKFVFLYDLTQKEVAEQLGISVITVSRRVKEGLASLKKLMLVSED